MFTLAIALSSLLVALSAFARRAPVRRELTLNSLTIGGGANRVTLTSERITFERDGKTVLVASTENGQAAVTGGNQDARFLLTTTPSGSAILLAGEESKALLSEKHLALKYGEDRCTLEPATLQIERQDMAAIGLHVENGFPCVTGVTPTTNFRIAANPVESASLLLTDGTDKAVLLANGLAVENAEYKSALVPTGVVEKIGETAPQPKWRPTPQRRELKEFANPHGLKIYNPDFDIDPTPA